MDDNIRKLANDCLTTTLHGSIPTKTTMALAEAIINEPEYGSIEQRGLVIISALINFIDWLDDQEYLRMPFTEEKRGQFVLKFLQTHSKGQNCFKQAEDIAKRLAIPFKPGGEQKLESIHSVSKKIVEFLNLDPEVESVKEDIETIASIITEDLGIE